LLCTAHFNAHKKQRKQEANVEDKQSTSVFCAETSESSMDTADDKLAVIGSTQEHESKKKVSAYIQLLSQPMLGVVSTSITVVESSGYVLVFISRLSVLQRSIVFYVFLISCLATNKPYQIPFMFMCQREKSRHQTAS
jgi:hypothetical protein